MAYRDELSAARERIEALEAELEESRQKIAELERRPLARPWIDPPAAAMVVPPRRAGAVRYHPPPTYWPMLHLWRACLLAAIASRPKLTPLESDRVIAWAFHYGVKTVVLVVRAPLYWLTMAILLPWAGVLCLVFGMLMLPFLALSRLTFSDTPPPETSEFLAGRPSRRTGAVFLWLLASVPMPLLMVGCFDLLTEE